MNGLRAKLGYSADVDVLVVDVLDRKYHSSVPLGNFIFDLDSEGKVIGIEILDASRMFNAPKDILRKMKAAQARIAVRRGAIRINIELFPSPRKNSGQHSVKLQRVFQEGLSPMEVRLAVA